MSFRTDKTRGAHPITPKKGIKEVDLSIKEKGVNDRIVVSVKPNKEISDKVYFPDALSPFRLVGKPGTQHFEDAKGRLVHGDGRKWDSQQRHMLANLETDVQMGNRWDKMSEHQRKDLMDEIGFYHHYVDTNWKNIPWSVREKFRGRHLDDKIEKKWDDLYIAEKERIIDETYHGGMSIPLVKELKMSSWERLPEMNKKEIKAHLSYGNR